MIQKLFGPLRYETAPAALELADWVDGYWRVHNTSGVAHPYTVLPDGYAKLVLTREPGRAPRLTLAGVWTQPFEVAVAAHATVTGIRFKLLAAEFLGPLPLNTAVALPLNFWLAPVLLAEDLPTMAQHLRKCLAACQPDPRLRRLFACLYQGAGERAVPELAAAASWSPRQANRFFQAKFGFSLKTYGNVLRSYAAARQLQPRHLYAAGGYCDQSHGIRELKKYTGATPRQLDQHRHDRFIQLCPPLALDLCATLHA